MRISAVLPIAAIALVLTVPAVAQAAAPGTPSVTFSFSQQAVMPGAQAQLRYSAANLPPGSRILLQLQYGTPPAWAYVETLEPPDGTAALPVLPAGLYLFRIRILRGTATVATTPGRYLTVEPASASSGCTVCQLFGGIGGAIVSWLLQKVPLIIRALPW